jgi:hypothetical protein
MSIKEIYQEPMSRKDMRNCMISKILSDELRRTKTYLEQEYYKKHKVKKKITIMKTSRFLARIYKQERYKFQNGKRYV